MALSITLYNPKSKEKKTYTQDFVPLKKQLELLQLVPENYPDLNEAGWLEKNVEFSANLFDSKAVTSEAILNGIESADFEEFLERAQNSVYGVDPKKAETVEKP